MSRSFLGTVLAAHKNQLVIEGPMRWLIEVQVPSDPPQRIRVTNCETDVSRGVNSLGQPILYKSFPVAHDEFRENQKGDLNNFTINVANITREFMEILELYDGLRDQPCIIRLVHQDTVTDPGAEIRIDATVLSTTVKDSVAIFTIGAVNVLKKNFPKNRYVADHCQVPKYGGLECGYLIPASPTEAVGGGFSTCPRTQAGCLQRGDDEVARGLPRKHPERYGGYPGVRLGAG